MKKLLIVCNVLILTSSIQLQALNIWGVNLTDKEQSFKYKKRKGLVGLDYHYFKVPPMSVSDGISNHGWGVGPVSGHLNTSDLTFIAYGNKTHFSQHETERTPPKKSKKLEEIIAKNFDGKKPEEVITNWQTFKE